MSSASVLVWESEQDPYCIQHSRQQTLIMGQERVGGGVRETDERKVGTGVEHQSLFL